jgi:hypothetical protein
MDDRLQLSLRPACIAAVLLVNRKRTLGNRIEALPVDRCTTRLYRPELYAITVRGFMLTGTKRAGAIELTVRFDQS